MFKYTVMSYSVRIFRMSNLCKEFLVVIVLRQVRFCSELTSKYNPVSCLL